MPRISHSLLLRAYKTSSLLPLILRCTRDLQSSKNEFRWLIEHVQETIKGQFPLSFTRQKHVLLKLCRRRERGEPLQYILGSQPFGELSIKCRRGVLIPRPETESYTTHLEHLLFGKVVPSVNYELHVKGSVVTGHRPLKILDICSGTGCIGLLLNDLLSKTFDVETLGLDISEKAIKLANENEKALISGAGNHGKSRSSFVKADIFQDNIPPGEWDVVIANPPYISKLEFNKRTSRSVRNWEPKEALVPQSRKLNDADIFYRRIIQLDTNNFKSKVLVMEVDNELQAVRVIQNTLLLLGSKRRYKIEIWADAPATEESRRIYVDVPEGNLDLLRAEKAIINVRGSGAIRSVVIYGFSISQQDTDEQQAISRNG